MMESWFRKQIGYHYWATARLLRVMEALTPEQYDQDLGSSFPSIRATLAHLISVEEVWLGRLTGALRQPVTAESLLTLDEAGRRWGQLAGEYLVLLDRLGETWATQSFQVRTSTGQSYSHTYGEVFQHLVNHGTYHRGQIATMLRQVGLTPPATDLIIYLREQSGQQKDGDS